MRRCYYVNPGGANIHVVGKATGMEFRNYRGTGGIQWNNDPPRYVNTTQYTITQTQRLLVGANGMSV